jgi:hypothetical protein
MESASAGCWCYSTTIEPCIGSVLERTGMKHQENDVVAAVEVEDCPLCCDPMNEGDVRYPLICPTMTCNFNYCANCIQRFVQAAAEGYQMASDGSHQVKVIVKCPVCRSKYQITNHNDDTSHNYTNTNNNITTTVGSKLCTYSSEIIVQAVLTLRQATTMEALMNAQDCDLNASTLAKRQQFIEDISMEELEDAYIRIQAYHNALVAIRKYKCPGSNNNNDDDTNVLHVVPLDWELFRPVLRAKRVVPNNNNQKGTNNGTNNINTATGNNHAIAISSAPGWKDPTLFGGLEELMTSSEHEFITSMLISGQSETLSQAASILHSVMDITSSRRAQTAVRQMAGTVQSYPDPQLSSGATAATTTTSTASSLLSRPVRFSAKESEHIQRVRGRFPLPIHMPRCVSIPLHDPDQVMGTRSQLLYFIKDTSNKSTASTSNDQYDNSTTATAISKQHQYTLTLQSVSGVAGRVGLRKGDIVTHVEGNAVETYDEFATMLQQLLLSQSSTNISQNGGTPNVHIIVNATPEIAEALRKRYDDMQKANVRFYY